MEAVDESLSTVPLSAQHPSPVLSLSLPFSLFRALPATALSGCSRLLPTLTSVKSRVLIESTVACSREDAIPTSAVRSQAWRMTRDRESNLGLTAAQPTIKGAFR